jgi:RNA polymerase sigma-70 factor (ECF subfamily)
LENEGRHTFEHFKVERTQESYTKFFDFYFRRLVQFAVTITRSELLAEEIVLDVFLKLWTKRDSLHSIRNIETYLFVSVRNTAINSLRKEQNFDFDMLEDSHIELADYQATGEDELVEHEMLHELNCAVKKLPAKCKIVFKLIREDGLNRNEVAHILNISVKTVDNQVAIAVQKVAEQLNIDLSHPQNSKRLMTFLLAF